MTDIYHGETDQPPLHGYRGEAPAAIERWPCGLTIAISREAGARGGSIAQRVGRKLGWQVVDQDQLEYLAQDDHVLDELPDAARAWAELRLDELLRARTLSTDPAVIHMARVVLALGTQGEVVLIGRGAGFVLPPASTLHVRVVAPLPDRVAYMSQLLRLTEDEAAEEVRQRDAARAAYLFAHLKRQTSDAYSYDLLVNSGRLGEEVAAELVAQAARTKLLNSETLSSRPDEER
jgi:cytidylate kinase